MNDIRDLDLDRSRFLHKQLAGIGLNLYKDV